MNDNTNNDDDKTRRIVSRNRRTYTVPKLEKLGELVAVTGGPAGGSLDLLYGNNGGFQSVS